MKYGVDQCIGDSLGPGGIFRGLRTIPVLADIAREAERLCPGATILNYANPMAACCLALGKVTNMPYIGLCHGVQTTLDLISRYVGVPKDQIDFWCAGINHMAWFLSLKDKRDGRDLYPVLRANCERPEYYVNEKVRCEVMRQFGYFMTESTGHLSEYLPWFRSSERALKLYCDEPGFGGETGAYYKYCNMLAEKYADVDYLSLESTKIGQRSVEYCSYMEAMETDRPFRLNGTVRNDGYITNLPAGCCVEVPVYVDARGLHLAARGRSAAATGRDEPEQYHRAAVGRRGRPHWRPGAYRPRHRYGSAHQPLHAQRSSRYGRRDARSRTPVAAAVRRQNAQGDADYQHPQGRHACRRPTDPALAIANRFQVLAEQKQAARNKTGACPRFWMGHGKEAASQNPCCLGSSRPGWCCAGLSSSR